MVRRDTEARPLTAALRADRRSFAAFATLLLALQLLLSGLGLGKAAAEIALFGPKAICSQSEGGTHVPSPSGHRECPCLAAGCCQPLPAALPDADTPVPAPFNTVSAGPVPPVEPPLVDRRPLSLFARAGHSPPSLS